MDFSREIMEARGHGVYERLDPGLLPSIYLAYRTSLSEGTEVFHSNVRERWRAGDPEIVEAMRTWASYAEQGRRALMEGDDDALDRLIDANFDLRARIYRIGDANREMIDTARRCGASANFAGSGGAIVGAYRGEDMYAALVKAMTAIGVGILKPRVVPLSTAQ